MDLLPNLYLLLQIFKKIYYIEILILYRVCNMGGNSNNGSKCGMFYFNLNNDASNSNDNNGFRLAKAIDNVGF